MIPLLALFAACRTSDAPTPTPTPTPDADADADADADSDTDADADSDTDADADADSDTDADTDTDTDADTDTDVVPQDCGADSDLGSDVLLAPTSTCGQGDDVLTSCGGAGEELVVQWTAPNDGTFRFIGVFDDGVPVTLAMQDCGGQELACATDDVGAIIERPLAAGESVRLVLQGADCGAAILNISEVSTVDTGLPPCGVSAPAITGLVATDLGSAAGGTPGWRFDLTLADPDGALHELGLNLWHDLAVDGSVDTSGAPSASLPTQQVSSTPCTVTSHSLSGLGIALAALPGVAHSVPVELAFQIVDADGNPSPTVTFGTCTPTATADPGTCP